MFMKNQKFFILILVTALLFFSGSFDVPAAGEAPVVFRVSEGVKPGRLLTIYGEYLTGSPKVEFLRSDGNTVAVAEAVQRDPNGHFCRVVFPNIAPGVYLIRVYNGEGSSKKPVFVNKAYPRWVSEERAYAGMKMKLLGRNLDASEYGGTRNTEVRFVPVGGGTPKAAIVTKVTPYCVDFTVPKDIKNGKYYLEVRTKSSGYGLEWVRLDNASECPVTVTDTIITVERQPADATAREMNVAWANDFNWSNVVNVVTEFGANGKDGAEDTTAFQRAVDHVSKNGGGVVYVPAGTYYCKTIWLGSNVIIKGESRENTLIKYVQYATKGLFESSQQSADIGLQGICNLKITMKPGSNPKKGSILINLGKYNYPINRNSLKAQKMFIYNTVIDLGFGNAAEGYSSTVWRPYLISGAGHVLIAKNKFYSPRELWNPYIGERWTFRDNYVEYSSGYMPFSSDKLLVYGNTIKGRHIDGYTGELHGIFNGMNGQLRWNQYYGDNVVLDMAGGNKGDGEVQSYDGFGFGFAGDVTNASKNSADVLAQAKDVGGDFDPLNKEYHAIVIKGKGLGQLRRVTSFTDLGGNPKKWKINVSPAWDVAPDNSSKISVGQFNVGYVSEGLKASNCDKNHQLYQGCIDCVIADFTSERTDGIGLYPAMNSGYVGPTYFNVIKRNKLSGISPESGNTVIGERSGDSWSSWDGKSGFWAVAMYGNEYTDNIVDRKGAKGPGDQFGFAGGIVQFMEHWAAPEDGSEPILASMFEGNTVRNSEYGIYNCGAVKTCWRGNCFEGITKENQFDAGVSTAILEASGVSCPTAGPVEPNNTSPNVQPGEPFSVDHILEEGEQSLFSNEVPDSFVNDAQYELGFRFKTKVDGYITKVRVFTHASEGGNHTVRIWRVSDKSCVSGPYNWNIKAGKSGWKTFTLPQPFPIKAGNEYIAAVSNSAGDRYYAATSGGFNQPLNRGDLITFTGSGTFSESIGEMPEKVFNNTNYFRDIVFTVKAPATPSPKPSPKPTPSVAAAPPAPATPSPKPSPKPSEKPEPKRVLNLIKNPDFETGNFTGWYQKGSSISKVNQKTGNYCAKISGKSSGIWQVVTGLKPNTEYTLKAFIKQGGSGQAAYLYVDSYGGPKNQIVSKSTKYTLYKITFKTGSNGKSCRIGLIRGSSDGICYGDSFELLQGKY